MRIDALDTPAPQDVVARELLQPPFRNRLRPASSGPEHRTRRSAREQRDHVLAALDRVSRACRRAYELIVTSHTRCRTTSISSSKLAPTLTSASASHTIRLATSPSLCPPRPSATPQMPTSVRSMNESWLISRTQPGSLAAADLKRGGDGSSISVSGSVTVSTRAATDSHRRSAHAPSSSDANASG